MSTEKQLELINKQIEEVFIPVVDRLHPGKFKDETRKRSASLSALALHLETGLGPEECCKAIVDGFDDKGIDAVLNNPFSKKIFFVQSKLVEKGKKSIEKGEVLKLLEGVKLVLDQDEGLLSRFQKSGINVTDALDSTDYSFILILVSTGSELQSKSEEPLSHFLKEQNTSEEWVFFQEYNLDTLADGITELATEAKIDIELPLEHFGEILQPTKMYYGLVEVSVLGEVHNQYGNKLFFKNIRSFLGKGDVNDDIQNSLKKNKDQFVYLNNGITILCETVTKKRGFGSKTLAGIFVCKGVRVINGAQTLGSIGSVSASGKIDLTDVKVFVRLIESGGAEDIFSQRVTVASNTQNKIEKIDFASMEKQQVRLEKEILKHLSVTYHRMRSGSVNASGITMEDAGTALSCFEEDENVSTYHNREKNKLWENLEAEPYMLLFNSTTSCYKVFNTTFALVKVKSLLEGKIKSATTPKEKSFAKVVDIFLLHILFLKMTPKLKSDFLNFDCSSDLEKYINENWEVVYAKSWGLIQGESGQISRLFITVSRVSKLKANLIPLLEPKTS
jgi:hypothetical protein